MQKQRDTVDDVELESVRLSKLFLAEDRRAFDKLVLLHQKTVFTLCFRMLGEYDEADDCAQEVFIKVYRGLGRFRFESSFRTWLYRITVNTCKNRLNSLAYRIRSRSVRMSLTGHMQEATKEADIANNRRTPAVELMRGEVDRLIQKAINTLPAAQKLVVILRDVEGRSSDEIVELTGFKLGTVKSKL